MHLLPDGRNVVTKGGLVVTFLSLYGHIGLSVSPGVNNATFPLHWSWMLSRALAKSLSIGETLTFRKVNDLRMLSCLM
jgi:hypothetical protein